MNYVEQYKQLVINTLKSVNVLDIDENMDYYIDFLHDIESWKIEDSILRGLKRRIVRFHDDYVVEVINNEIYIGEEITVIFVEDCNSDKVTFIVLENNKYKGNIEMLKDELKYKK